MHLHEIPLIQFPQSYWFDITTQLTKPVDLPTTRLSRST